MTNNDDKGKAAEATICVKCKNCIALGAWDEHLCKAHPKGLYITGKPQAYGHCCNWNMAGTCPDYEERGDDG